LLTLPYLSNPSDLHSNDHIEPLLLSCRVALNSVVERPAISTFMQRHWADWVAPVESEYALAEQWGDEVDRLTGTAEEHYRRDYLGNPDYSDTLERAIEELLDLLEIPGWGDHISQVRNAITWPARKVIQWVWTTDEESQKKSPEGEVLLELFNHSQAQLLRFAGNRLATVDGEEKVWWGHVWHQLQAPDDTILTAEALISAHQQAFQPEIEAAAQELFDRLKNQPTTLNGLRAIRATADAAGIALALKTGGIGLHDLFLTPVMLTYVSLLTEGAVGQYIHKVEEDLKEKQIESLRTHFLRPLQRQWLKLPQQLPQEGLFSIPIAELDQARKELDEKEKEKESD
jgi:hypothetical protein